MMNISPWNFDTREPSTAATVISEADILKAADALAEWMIDHVGHYCYECDWASEPSKCKNDSCDNVEALRLVYAYEKARKGKR